MNTQKLRQKILNLAIRGKLVPQMEGDEPASVLLSKIKAEKARLVKEGKIRKSKALPHIAEGEKAFDLPSGWEWVRFEEFSNIIGVGLVRSNEQQKERSGYSYFKMNNIENSNGNFNLYNMPNVKANADEVERFSLEDNDFLFNTRNSYELVGKTTVVSGVSGKSIIYNNNILKVKFFGNIIPKYINYYFISSAGQAILRNFVSSTTNVAAIYQKQLITIACPLPPIAEQKRIVQIVELLFAQMDEIEKNKQDLQALIKKAKSKILGLAIHGKLVPQDPNDEPIDVPEFDGEQPFEVQQNWRWIEYQKAVDTISIRDYQIKQSEIYAKGLYPVVSQSQNLIEGYSDNEKRIVKIESPYLVFGDHTKVVKYVDFDFIVGADGVKIIKPLKCDTKYLYYFTIQAVNNFDRGYSRHWQFLKMEPMPLPPLAEQQRIVVAIETLFAKLDRIEVELE